MPRSMPRVGPLRQLALAALTLAAVGAPAQPASAADGLPALDRRGPATPRVPAARRAARVALREALGPLARVRAAPHGGGVASVGSPLRTLTDPDAARSSVEIALGYVRAHRDVFGLGEEDVRALALVARSVSPGGVTHLRFNQTLEGIPSLDSGLDAHVARDGRLIAVSGGAVPGARLPATRTVIPAERARTAARAASGGVARSVPEPAVLRWAATADGPLLVWDVVTSATDGGGHQATVDARTGALIRRRSLSSSLGQAAAFAADPELTAQTPLTMPPDWYENHAGGTRLWGRYARTYADPGGEDPAPGSESGGTRVQVPASTGAPAAPDWVYAQTPDPTGAPCPAAPASCTWDSATPASAATNRLQAATNLHVLVSRFHDHLQAAPIGFDEASGNFQAVNTSGAGIAGDYVRAESSDGSGLNGANFVTPPDGQAPRLQVRLFGSNAPATSPRDVDGSDAADLVWHEYAHGLSSRLVVTAGGAVALGPAQSAMLGEGWSDFYAQDLLVADGNRSDTATPGELRLFTYPYGPGGVRAKPLDCPVAPAGVAGCDGNGTATTVLGGYTYGDLAATDNASPHNGGEVWAQTLWDIRGAVGRAAALRLITGGMRLAPDDPSMLDARDAILQYALATASAPGAPDDHYEALWQVFAARGMGYDATTTSAASTSPIESFVVPAGLRLGATTISDPYPAGDADGVAEPGEELRIAQVVTGIGPTDLPGVSGTLTSPVLMVLTGAATWPMLGRERSAPGSPTFAVRMPPTCLESLPFTIDVASSEGDAARTMTIDPRIAAEPAVTLADPGVTSTDLGLPAGGTIADVDIRIDDLRHPYVGDLTLELLHAGVTVLLTDRFGAPSWNGDDIRDLVFDDEAAGLPPLTSPITGRHRAATPAALAALDGHPVGGTWTLRVTDHVDQDGGTLYRWGLDSPQAPCRRAEIPAAGTGPAQEITATGARLTGTGTPNGRATALRFAYGTTGAYGAATAAQPLGSGSDAVASDGTVSGLQPATTYHYRAEAIREGGVVAVTGADRTFTTADVPGGDPAPASDPAAGPAPGSAPTPTPAAPPASPSAGIRGLPARLWFDRRGRARITFTAPPGVRTAVTLVARLPRASGRAETVTLARRSVTVPASGRVRATLALRAAARRRLGARTRLAHATLSVRAGTRTARRSVALRLARAR